MQALKNVLQNRVHGKHGLVKNGRVWNIQFYADQIGLSGVRALPHVVVGTNLENVLPKKAVPSVPQKTASTSILILTTFILNFNLKKASRGN